MEIIKPIDLWTEQYKNHYECFNGAFVDGFENNNIPFDEYKNMIKLILNEFWKIDVLVNNAGVAIDKEFEERTVEDWRTTLNTNLIAPFLVSKYVGDEMLKKCGKIINISSTNGINTYSQQV